MINEGHLPSLALDRQAAARPAWVSVTLGTLKTQAWKTQAWKTQAWKTQALENAGMENGGNVITWKTQALENGGKVPYWKTEAMSYTGKRRHWKTEAKVLKVENAGTGKRRQCTILENGGNILQENVITLLN